MDPLDTLFAHLDAWRHLPAYQLERRVDIFFSVYLRAVVEKFTRVVLEEEMIPELPIKRDLVWPDVPSDQSVKVDYALFAKDRSKVFFVELKTDGASRNPVQDEYLAEARRLGFRPILEGIRAIVCKTTAHQKYHHLACALARLGYLELPRDLESYLYPAPRTGLAAKLAEITVPPNDVPIEVIYVQPAKTPDDRCIDFDYFAAHVAQFDDPFSRRFCEHLKRWSEAAGKAPPMKAVATPA